MAGHSTRGKIGLSLHGDVLEVGPGFAPFPTATDARVIYADRSVESGRDATWPELIGQPRGPDAHIETDLDVEGLEPVGDQSFDVVIACHLIEHLANPVRALCEFERVLRPGGTLVLVVPDRTRTFDRFRQPTPLAHVLDEFDRQVTEVDVGHIEEFCASIYDQPPIHPDQVREWHNPANLDDTLISLHRQRTIHVHCWSPEEFAAVVAACLARGLMSWELVDLYFFDDVGDHPDDEFGLVLRRSAAGLADPPLAFVEAWTTVVLDDAKRDPRRVAALQRVLATGLEDSEDLNAAAAVIGETLAARVDAARVSAASLEGRLAEVDTRLQGLAADKQALQDQLSGVLGGRSYRFSRVLSRLARPFLRHA
jgi:SAM-dependent methyltransferase